MAKLLIVEARFYGHLNDMLIAGARDALEAAPLETPTGPAARPAPATAYAACGRPTRVISRTTSDSSCRMTMRLIMFSSSRMLPGQS